MQGPVPDFPMVTLSEEDLSRYLDESVPLPAVSLYSVLKESTLAEHAAVFGFNAFCRCLLHRKPAI